jgi:hypothetical protein
MVEAPSRTVTLGHSKFGVGAGAPDAVVAVTVRLKDGNTEVSESIDGIDGKDGAEQPMRPIGARTASGRILRHTRPPMFNA